MDKNIAIAQLNTIAGNIEHNLELALKTIKKAKENSVDLIIFPELFLIGNPIFDVPKRYPKTIKKNIEALNDFKKECENICAIIGFMDEDFSSSIAFIQNGKIKNVIKKNTERIINFDGKKIQILFDEEFCDENSDLIINCTPKITKTKQDEFNHKYLSKFKTPIIWSNQFGATDGFIYNGASCVYKNGELIARAKSFEEDILFVNLNKINRIEQLPKGIQEAFDKKNCFDIDYEYDLERTYLALISGIKNYFFKNGFNRAILGLSGGLDSTVCAVLLCDALGAKNVTGVSMPSRITSDESKNDAKELGQNLGLNFLEIPIKDMVKTTKNTFDGIFENLEKTINGRFKESLTMDNIQARARATILWGISNEFSSMFPIATSDKSELYMGYATINGDMSGSYAPLADITKTKLFALARWMNKNRVQKNAIPNSILLKPPGAELAINPKTNKPLTAEEALMPYEFLDEIIWRVENLGQNSDEMMDIEFEYEKKNKLDNKTKREWLEKFKKRVRSAQFKGNILPPAPIIDTNSTLKAVYRQPISGNFEF